MDQPNVARIRMGEADSDDSDVDDSDPDDYGLCSGTLISPTVVLTAAHCLLDEDEGVVTEFGPEDLSVELGGQDRVVVATHVNPSYDPVRAFDDVALLELQEPVEGIEPMLVLDDVDQPDLDTVMHMGWGNTVPGGSRATTLQSATCTLQDEDPAVQEQLAAQRDLRRLISVCRAAGKPSKGDSGGPMVVHLPDGRLALAGVQSTVKDLPRSGVRLSSTGRVDRGTSLELVEDYAPETVWVSWDGSTQEPQDPAQGPPLPETVDPRDVWPDGDPAAAWLDRCCPT